MSTSLVPMEVVSQKIFLIRGVKVMLATDLADLYEMKPGALVQAVKRNTQRFPDDFMFQLSLSEAIALKSQTVISKGGRGGSRHAPYAFTEHGVAMLSSVLRSPRAVQMNIFIIRAFIKLRELLATNKELALKVEELEKDQQKYGEQITAIHDFLKRLSESPEKPKQQLGFSRN